MLRHRKDKYFVSLLDTPAGAYLASSCSRTPFKDIGKGFLPSMSARRRYLLATQRIKYHCHGLPRAETHDRGLILPTTWGCNVIAN